MSSISFRTIGSTLKPVCTIAIPIAIDVEPLEQIAHTVGVIIRAAKGVGPVQIILWCNLTAGSGKVAESRSRYDALCTAIKHKNYSKSAVSFLLGFDILPNRFPSTAVGLVKKIKQARTNYMNVIIDQQQRGELPADHPIFWLDADTTFIAHDALKIMLTALNNNQAHFIKGRLLLTGNINDNRTHALRSQAEQVAALYSITKAMLEEQLRMFEPRGYVEECGLVFKLSAYVNAGGLAYSRGPLQGESRVLLGRAKKRLNSTIPLVAYISNAVHGTSYRRIFALAHTIPAYDLPEHQSGSLYQLCTNIEVDLLQRVNVTAAQVTRMIDKMIEDHVQAGHRPLEDEQYQRLIQLALQFDPNQGGTDRQEQLQKQAILKNHLDLVGQHC